MIAQLVSHQISLPDSLRANSILVARTPEKLTNLLTEKGIDLSTITEHLHITKGDSLDLESVKGPLTLNGRPVDIIFSGIGTSPSQQEITLCEDSAKNIIAALKELQLPKKPLLVALSTTGIYQDSNTPRDVPYLMKPLYSMMLHQVHADKTRMEKTIEDHHSGEGSVISGFVMPKPSMLLDGEAKSVHDPKKIKVGQVDSPAVGYVISRNDVGYWMFENLIQGDGSKWAGTKPTLTY